MKSLEEYVAIARRIKKEASGKVIQWEELTEHGNQETSKSLTQREESLTTPSEGNTSQIGELLENTQVNSPCLPSSTEKITVGSLIEWKSPIFGLLTGVVEMIPGDGTLVVDHPLTKGLADQATAFIHAEWVTRVVS